MPENEKFKSVISHSPRNNRRMPSYTGARSLRRVVERVMHVEGLETRQHLAGDVHMFDGGGVYGELPRAGGEAQILNRWTTTANGSTGAVGNPATLTWGFIADGVSIPGGAVGGEPTAGSSLQARLNTLYGSSAVWQPLFQNVFDRWSALSGLTFNFTGLFDDGAAMPQSGVSNGSAGVLGVRPDIRIGGHFIDGGSGSNVLAYCYFPNVGDMVIDTSNFDAGSFYTGTANNSRGLRNVVAHEMGHGLGFSHVEPVNQTKLMEPFVSTAYDGPQFDDIYAAQINYGDPFEKGGRNDTAPTASNLGTLVNGTNAVSSWVNANNPTQARSIANTTDADYLKFTITGAKNLGFTVSPFGPTYSQGPQGGSSSSFNASSQGNLSFTVFDTNGTSVLTSANVNGLGASETATLNNLPAGTYFLRVNISAGATQAYNVSITSADALVVGPPSTPDLDASSDAGPFSVDNITNDTTPTFIGTAVVGSTVNLFSGATLVGTGVTDLSGNWSVTVLTPLSAGSPTFTATATVGVTTSVASGPITITIDTTAPFVSSASFSRSPVQAFDFTLSENVFGSFGNFGLVNSSFQFVPTVLGATTSNSARYFPSPANSLGDSSYTGTLNLGTLTDLAGNTQALSIPTLTFKFLRADFNADNSVGFDDLLLLAQNYGLPGLTHAQGDANYDGSINFDDLLIVAQTYGNSLVLGGQGTTVPTDRVTRSATKRGRGADDVLGTATTVI